MALEIERKFRVRDESWQAHCTGQHEIRDGLVAVANGRKVRVRICDLRATLTVKVVIAFFCTSVEISVE